MTRYFLNAIEVSREKALLAWLTSSTFQFAAHRHSVWPRAELGGADPHGAAAHLAEAGIRIERPPAGPDAQTLEAWHEDIGPVVWWRFPVDEPAWIGTPLDSDWPGYHTHWTPHPPIPEGGC